MTGLPSGLRACLFDLDGVLTATAELHQIAWRDTFDAVLADIADEQRPFAQHDYDEHVDGKPREDGVRAFLAARSITLPEGQPDDPPGTGTVHAIGNRKNAELHRLIDQRGVHVYPGSLRYLEAVRDSGTLIAVVTSSANGERVLRGAGLTEFPSLLVDGKVLQRRGLRGKPAPDAFRAAAEGLDVPAEYAAVFEDALSGVRAGREGGFYVVGVDRTEQGDALRAAGADLVVRDLAELLEQPNDH